MLRQLFLKNCKTKSLAMFFVVALGLVALMGSSCDPKQRSENTSPRSPVRDTETARNPEKSGIDPVVDAICQGDFELARQMLKSAPADRQTQTLTQLLDKHAQVEQQRGQKRQAAFEEQLAELETIKETVSEKETPDVNDIDDTMIAVIRAREFALPEDKDALLEDSFVKGLLEQMIATADEQEKEGKWLEAYAHCYYWLSALYKDDPGYEDKAEELTELSAIELALKDSTCGETAIERYEGVEAVMYLRALQLLHSNYVNMIDYHSVTQDALKRCRLLGTVLERTSEDLAWSASEEQVFEWKTGLETIWNPDFENTDSVEVKDLATLLENILVLNSITLNLPEEVIIAHFAEASLSSLDPFTNLVWPWNVRDFEKSMTQQFTGIGVEISKATGVLKVVSLLPDTPAYTSGLDADDEIVAVDGELTEDMTIYCAISKITGPKGTKVTLTIRRPATNETKDISITRDKIVVQPLRGWIREADGDWNYLIDPENRIGYLRLTAFTESSGPDIDEVLRKLEKNGLNGLILDLRFNSGGYLQAAAEVVDLFVKEGVIVKSNPRQGTPTYEIAHSSGTHPNYPLVVLINGSSASASEIVAGALQDSNHLRATLVGQRTYGKGSVQVVTPFTGGGSQLKYTVAYYHLPSDQQVKNRYEMIKLDREDWGISSDVEVKMLSNELREMIDVQRSNDVLTRNDHIDSNGDHLKRHTLKETLHADPQLSIGLLVLQSKIVAQGNEVKLEPVLADNTSTQTVQNEAQ